eukprot:g5796.t1
MLFAGFAGFVALALLPFAAPAQFTPGLTVTVRLEGIAHDDSGVSAVAGKLASGVEWPSAQAVVAGAVDATPAAETQSPAACARVRLTGLPAGHARLDRMGDYVMQEQAHNNRPYYKSETPHASYLYLHVTDDARAMWVAGPTLGSDQAGVMVRSNADAPQDAAAGTWYAFDGTWESQPGLKAVCDPFPATDLTVRFTTADMAAPAGGCRSQDETTLQALEPKLGYLLRTNGLVIDLRNAGLGALRRLDYLRHRVRGCEPLLKLGWAGKSHKELAVSQCHFDGKQIRIQHEAAHHHTSFACSHRRDEETMEWRCACRSWTDTSGGTAAPLGQRATPAPTYYANAP